MQHCRCWNMCALAGCLSADMLLVCTQLEFFAEDTLVTIVPYFSLSVEQSTLHCHRVRSAVACGRAL